MCECMHMCKHVAVYVYVYVHVHVYVCVRVCMCMLVCINTYDTYMMMKCTLSEMEGGRDMTQGHDYSYSTNNDYILM